MKMLKVYLLLIKMSRLEVICGGFSIESKIDPSKSIAFFNVHQNKIK